MPVKKVIKKTYRAKDNSWLSFLSPNDDQNINLIVPQGPTVGEMLEKGFNCQKVIVPDGNGNPVLMGAGDAISALQSTGSNRIGDSSPSITGAGNMGYGTVNLRQINSLALDNVFLGWGELSLLQQNIIVNNICSIFADSMTEKWISFKSKNKAKSQKIIDLEKHIKKFKLKDRMNELVYKTILMGTAYFSPKFNGDEEEIGEELLLSSAKIHNNLENFYVIEPTWVVPTEFNMVNPRAKNFYKPQFYNVFGDNLHASRMKQLMYIEPVNLLSPMYLFGGQPLIQALLTFILDFLNTKKQIVQVISRFNTNVMKTNLNALKGQDAYGKGVTLSGNVKGRAAAFNAVHNNFGMYFIGTDEEFIQIQIPLTGMTDILQQQGELLSLFTRLPISKLFGQAPRGMNATGEYDANNFNELIHSVQEAKLRPIFEYAINILMLDKFGEIDEEIEFDFVPLGELNETTQSQLKTDKLNRYVSTVQAGMADPVGMMDLVREDPDLEFEDYQPSEFADEEGDEDGEEE